MLNIFCDSYNSYRSIRASAPIFCGRTFLPFFISLCLLFSSCKKLIEIDPPQDSINEENVFSDNETAIAAVTGIFVAFNQNCTGYEGLSLLPGLSADELTLYGGVSGTIGDRYQAYYQNTLVANSQESPGGEFWIKLYNNIYNCNVAIERLSDSSAVDRFVRYQLIGEAKFIRGLAFFYLTNLYNKIPLTLSSDYVKNAALTNVSADQVYAQIISDLKDAETLLSEDYLNATLKSATSERVRPTRYAASSLLARIYLYTKKWELAEVAATTVIEQHDKFVLEPDLNLCFIANSGEAIWQLQPVNPGWNTEDARVFRLPESGPSDYNGFDGNPAYLSKSLLTTFEPYDKRRIYWIDSVITPENDTFFFANKYKISQPDQPRTEYETVLRLSEQYLIRAEARLAQNDIEGAKNDLNAVRNRAGVPVITTDDANSLMSAILKERRVELFTEWGHRWFDLKRVEKVNEIMEGEAVKKQSDWESYQQFYPIPFSEILSAPQLHQNSGY